MAEQYNFSVEVRTVGGTKVAYKCNKYPLEYNLADVFEKLLIGSDFSWQWPAKIAMSTSAPNVSTSDRQTRSRD
jgi:hypothetical protein